MDTDVVSLVTHTTLRDSYLSLKGSLPENTEVLIVIVKEKKVRGFLGDHHSQEMKDYLKTIANGN